MERRAFQTPLGEVWLWGDRDAFTGSRPVILVIHGAFQAERSAFFDLPPYFPDAAVLLAHLPGNHSPELVRADVATYAAALDHALASFSRRALIPCGVSTGALMAMAMKTPVIGSVLIEPPLRTAKLWPLIEDFRRRDAPWARRFVQSVFGYYPDRIVDQDYRPLLSNLTRRAWVLLGETPLMPQRPLDEIPSLVDEPERDLLRSHPLVRVAVSPGVGHNIPQHNDKLIDAALTKVLGQLRSVR
jgi:pimeloyl-ACP methyl ester carboxylesterase